MNAIAARFEQINSATLRRRSKRFKRPSSAPPRRYGRYNVERLIAAHGADAKLPDLLATARRLPQGAFAQRPRPMQSGVSEAAAVTIA